MILSVTMKAAVLALAVAGYPLVWAAVVSDVGSCLIVIFNSMLLLQGSGSRSTTSGPQNSCKSSHSCQQPCCPSTENLQNTCDSICESTSDLEEPLLTSQNHCHANHSTNHCNSLNKDDKGTKPCCKSQRIDQACSPEFTTGNVECAAIDASCKARQVGCCQSFRKECCSKSSKFGGSLSEIVIE
nr:putative inactive cadmium/zinc-transporting ATPase HMA3 [Ipomoea batatas]